MRKIVKSAKEVPEAELKELKLQALNTLSETRRVMMQRQPFTGSVGMNLEIVPVRDLRLETAACDGKSIFFDIDFLSTLSQDEALFVMSHEIWHALLGHFYRFNTAALGPEERGRMNVATDLEVNQLLAKDGFCVLRDALMPQNVGVPCDLSAEQYYDILTERAKKQKKQPSRGPDQNGGGDSDQQQSGSCSSGRQEKRSQKKQGATAGQFDRHIYSGEELEKADGGQCLSDRYGRLGADPDFRPGDPKQAAERIRDAAVTAAQMVERTQGSLPGHIKGLVQGMLEAEIDWREQLQQFVTRSCCGEKREWNPPSRRHVWSGTYLQSRKGEKIKILVGLDVSGSTAGDIPKFLGELNGLVTSFGKYSVTVAQCDTEVQDCRTYTDDDPLDLENEKFETVGGGGTRLAPVFGVVDEMEDRPDAICMLTDGYCEKFTADMDPEIPVLWLVTKGGRKDFAEFGDVVEFKEAS
jgi:predicted metal-dependent peptidase